jgi:hypothetical protein
MLVTVIIISGGNLKGNVYKNNCHTTEVLQNTIIHVINSVSKDEFQKVSQNLFMHSKICLKAESSPPAVIKYGVCAAFLQ